MATINNNKLSFGIQSSRLKSIFPTSTVLFFTASTFIWKCALTPTPLSNTYDIRLEYKKNFHPCVFVINTTLQLYPGATELPHVYNSDKQHLCLYFRKGQEWNSTMYIAETIIPWASEWLFYYEIWLCTGEWNGGGISHEIKNANTAL